MFLKDLSDVSETFLALTSYLSDVILRNDVQVGIARESVSRKAQQNNSKQVVFKSNSERQKCEPDSN